MRERDLQVLEFDKVLQLLAGCALSSAGQEACLALRPQTTAEEVEAKTKLMNKLWGYTNTGTTGHVQQSIVDTGYVVVEAQVRRTKVHQETGKKEISTEMARFFEKTLPLKR